MADTRPNESAIREQAYLLWEQDGRPAGRDMEYWQRATVLTAEKDQVDTLTQAPPKPAPGKTVAAGSAKPAPGKTVAAGSAKPKAKSAASKMLAGPGKSAKAKAKKK